jgi:hypothetical protein
MEYNMCQSILKANNYANYSHCWYYTKTLLRFYLFNGLFTLLRIFIDKLAIVLFVRISLKKSNSAPFTRGDTACGLIFG